ncbi:MULTISPECIES: type II secretion system F family protein [unclassified Adlercreutzia]|uniref:type II secretion system F family protein n=1 Tax=unclassified Adlercreutzia TaxID=2636013 RepID=UPI0013EC16D8|nr:MULTISPECIES: type II secretion system F family protein [unclassified Adlercreutzia]
MVDSSALACTALVSAGAAGAFAGSWVLGVRRDARSRRRLLSAVGATEARSGTMRNDDFWASVARAVADLSRKITLSACRPIAASRTPQRVRRWFDAHVRKAGMDQTAATAEGLVETSVRAALMFAALFGAFGLAFSSELGVLGVVAGVAFGVSLPARAMLKLQARRAALLERELSEMLEVVALGLRSGLSFDRGFRLYCEHFSTPFARSCEAARCRWIYGLVPREQALRDLATSYDSPQLERVMESVIRSLRFGSSLAEVLEQAAAEARQAHRANVQERVAKAPVKMMVPTGTLILPAMLLLVLGPVLLELMNGF